MIGAAYAGSPVLRTEVAYAGFWRRFAAYWIDFAVLLGVQLVIASGVFIFAPDDLRTVANIAPVSSVIGWAYFALLESSPARGTLGKLALHLVVGDVHGDPITFRRASARYWLKVLSTLTNWMFGVAEAGALPIVSMSSVIGSRGSISRAATTTRTCAPPCDRFTNRMPNANIARNASSARATPRMKSGVRIVVGAGRV